LIESIIVDIDAVEHFPLRFAVYARGGGAPAIEIAFTGISFDRPDASQFTFNPPPGATVVDESSAPELPSPDKPEAKPSGALPEAGPDAKPEVGDAPEFAVVGTGWTTVLVLGVPASEPEGHLSEMLALLPPVSGDWGSGRVLKTKLFTALLTDDGRLLVGAVTPERLYQAASDPAADLHR
jgi:hypothetical protein